MQDVVATRYANDRVIPGDSNPAPRDSSINAVCGSTARRRRRRPCVGAAAAGLGLGCGRCCDAAARTVIQPKKASTWPPRVSSDHRRASSSRREFAFDEGVGSAGSARVASKHTRSEQATDTPTTPTATVHADHHYHADRHHRPLHTTSFPFPVASSLLHSLSLIRIL
jgi:hypothetical protein